MFYKVNEKILHFKDSNDKRDVNKSDNENEEESVERSILEFTLKGKKNHILDILLFAEFLSIRSSPSAVVVVQSHHTVALHQ